MKHFVVLTDKKIRLASGSVSEAGDIRITWRADIGFCSQKLERIEDALEIAPTAKRVEFIRTGRR